jgi:phosphopantetheinyl transferase
VGREIAPAEIAFPDGGKPRLQGAPACRGKPDESEGPDFSISHSGPWVGCAAVARGRIGLDIELGTDERVSSWTAREAVLKACGAGIGAARAVELRAEGATYRGHVLHARRVELFPGAAVCVMTSCLVQEINLCAFSLQELFAPWSLSTETPRP